MTFHLVHTQNLAIEEQLRLEESLLRHDARNWCLINEGSTPTIVMGISGKSHELVDAEKAAAEQIPVIKRFSGGGTVVVDEETLFITFICQKELHPFPAYPEQIMRWTSGIFRSAFQLPGFDLRENDFVIGDKKCGGNAQYIKKERWLHHISFLWNYKPERMAALLHPKRTPPYRQGRAHEEFLTPLSHHFASKEEFLNSFKEELQRRYTIIPADLNL